jgi:hypothetical protein
MRPSAELANEIKSAEKNVLGGKKLIGMNDTLGILKSLHNNLVSTHSKLVSSGVRHSGLADARAGLHGDSSVDPEHPSYLGSGDHLHLAGLLKANQTPLAWEHMHAAAQKIHAAYNSLSAVSPELSNLSVPHNVNGVVMNITPGAELLHISKPPGGGFKESGKTPNRIRVGNRVLGVNDVKQGMLRAKADPSLGVREEVRQDVASRLKGTKRTRKIQTPLETTDPKSPENRVEPLGPTATDVNRTGDWSGAENTRGMPESVIPKVDRERARRKGGSN